MINDPWSDDFAAVREMTTMKIPARNQARASLLGAADRNVAKRGFLANRFAAHPILTTIVIALVLLVLVPTSYALVKHLLIELDLDQSEETIQRQVGDDLRSVGVVDPKVDVEKTEALTKLTISGDQPLPDFEAQATQDGKPVPLTVVRIGLGPNLKFSPNELKALQDIVKNTDPKRFIRTSEMTDEDYADLFIVDAAKHGFVAEIIFDGSTITILLTDRI